MRVGGAVALLTLMALAGCLGDEANDTDSECPDAMDHHDVMEHSESMESTGSDAPQGGNATGNGTESLNLLRMRQVQGNETGNTTAGNETADDAADAADDEHDEHVHDPCAHDVMESNEDTMTTMAGAFLFADVTEGEAPVDVTFDFGVTSIPEDEWLEWTLDVNADGTPETEGNGLNLQGGANFTYTYTEGGTHNATFVATDGFESWDAVVVITITGGEDAEGEEPDAPVVEPTEQTFDGQWYLDSPACLGEAYGVADVTYAELTIDELTWGQSFFASFTGGFLEAAMNFEDASGTVLQSHSDLDEGEYYEIGGKIPEGAVTANFWTCITVTGAPSFGSVAYQTPA